MPNLNVPFAGQTLVIPGAYYTDNVTAALVPAPQTTPPLIFIGFGYGQKPFTPQTYFTPTDLLNAIRGGPASGFVNFMTNPSPQLNGAQQITFINVGENTQSSLTLQDSVPSGVISLQSVNYGLPSNLLQIQVANGSIAGKLITLFDGFSNSVVAGDNLGVPMQLVYTGNASGVTYSVIVSGGVATQLIATSPVSGQSATINLGPGQNATIGSVAAALNGTGFYNAVVIGNGNLPSGNLDAASGVSIVSGTGLQPVYATLGDIAYWVNTQAATLATAIVTPGTVSSSGVAPVNIPLTPFSGATSVPPTLSDYASGFNVALTVPGWAVFADSAASGVIALGVQHAKTASGVTVARWRRFFSGSTLGQTVAQAVAQAQIMDAFQASYAFPGIYAIDPNTGVNTLYSGLYVAAMLAGMVSGNNVATPLTNKALNATGVETQLTTSQINQLQQAGVIPIWLSTQTGIPTVVSDFTTWQIDPNPENVFNQQVACRQFLAYSLVNAAVPYVGTVANPLIESSILNAIKTTLNSLLVNSSNQNGILVSWDPNSLKLTFNGAQQLAAVVVNVIFVGQNRFITETVSVLPLTLSVSLAA